MLINENQMLEVLNKAKSIFLLEPDYARKYPPIGLAKIASYKKNGFVYGRQYNGAFVDLVCITSLFTYDIKTIQESIQSIRFLNKKVPILLGGVCASLLPNEFGNIYVFSGFSKTLDQCVPDYSINWQLQPPWDEYSFTFTSRGCPNKCPYCAVWRIEPEQWTVPNWREHIVPEKKFAMISDNNLSACPEQHILDVIKYLRDNKKRVVFDNGLDCKHITKEMAKELATLKYARTGLRLAFDRIEEDGVFQQAIERLISASVPKSSIMAYCLFNFNDTFQEANYRMSECVRLGIRPYPQQYQPLMWKDRKKRFIGKHWSLVLIRAFRYFWLMAGFYTKMSFKEFLNVKKGEKYKISAEDYDLMANAKPAGLHKGKIDQERPPSRHSAEMWPARPKQKQYDGEKPRTIKPRLGGAVDGTACRVDRLRMLGNGVVPQQAEWAFRCLMEKFKH